LDTASEELFPDLASAEKKLQEKQQQQTQSVTRIPKKTPVGGGASWASAGKLAPKLKLTSTPKLPKKASSSSSVKKDPEETKSAAVASSASETSAAPAPAPTPDAPVSQAAAPVTIQPKLSRKPGTKKKKKDLSTFKPSGAS
jgi:hypothetical protein